MKNKKLNILNFVLLFVAVLTTCFAVGTFSFNNKTAGLHLNAATLQETINAAEDGGSLEISGTISSPLTINKNITLRVLGTVALNANIVIENLAEVTISGGIVNGSGLISVGAHASLTLENCKYNAGAIQTSNQSNLHINGSTVTNGVNLHETAFLKISGTTTIGTINAAPNLNPIWVENGATLSGTEANIGLISINFSSEIANGRAVFYAESNSQTLANNTQLLNTGKKLLVPRTSATTELIVADAEVGYKEGSASYFYTTFTNAVAKSNAAEGKDCEIMLIKDCSGNTSTATEFSNAKSVKITTEMVNSYFQAYSLTLNSISTITALTLGGGLTINLTKTGSGDAITSTATGCYLTLTDSCHINYKTSYGVGLGVGAKVDLAWSSNLGGFTGTASKKVDIKNYEWFGGVPVRVSSTLSSKTSAKKDAEKFNNGNQIVLDAENPNGTVTFVEKGNGTVQDSVITTGNNGCFALYSDSALFGSGYVLQPGKDSYTNPILTLTNEAGITVWYTIDKKTTIEFEKTDTIVNLTKDKDSKKPAQFKLEGYTTTPGSNIITISLNDAENYPVQNILNGNFVFYAVYSLNLTIKYNYGTSKSKEVTNGPSYYAYNTTLSNITISQNISTPSGVSNTGFSLLGWSLSQDGTTCVSDSVISRNCNDENFSNGELTVNLYAVWGKTVTLYQKRSGFGFDTAVSEGLTGIGKTIVYNHQLKYTYDTTGAQKITLSLSSSSSNSNVIGISNYPQNSSGGKVTIKGYTFKGFATSLQATQPVTEISLTSATNSKYLYAVWGKNIRVNYQIQNPNATGYTVAEQLILGGDNAVLPTASGYNYTPVEKTYEHYKEPTITYASTPAEDGYFDINLCYDCQTFKIYKDLGVGVQKLDVFSNDIELTCANDGTITAAVGQLYMFKMYFETGFKLYRAWLNTDERSPNDSNEIYQQWNSTDSITFKVRASGTLPDYINYNMVYNPHGQEINFDTDSEFASGYTFVRDDGDSSAKIQVKVNEPVLLISGDCYASYYSPFDILITETASGATYLKKMRLRVIQATPIISVTNTSITAPYGATWEALFNEIQAMAYCGQPGCDQTCSVAGTFALKETAESDIAYNKTSGIVPFGTKTYEVVGFNPDDTNHYESVEVENISIKITIQIAELEFSNFLVGPITYGQSLAGSWVTATAINTTSNTQVYGLFNFKSPSTKPTVADSDNTEYAVIFTPEQNAGYYNVPNNLTVTITVHKAYPQLSNITATSITYGQTLASSTLTGTATNIFSNELIDGTWDFSDPSYKPGPSDQSVQIKFTPADTDNYDICTGSVTIIVNAAELEFIGLTASPIIYGQMLENSTITGTAKNKTTGETVEGAFAFLFGTDIPNASSASFDVGFIPKAGFSQGYYSNLTTSVSVTVNKNTPELSCTSETFAYGIPWRDVRDKILTYVQNSVNNNLKPTGTLELNGSNLGDVDRLPIGTNTINLTFTPDDSSKKNYEPANFDFVVTISANTITVGLFLTQVNAVYNYTTYHNNYGTRTTFTHSTGSDLIINFGAISGYTILPTNITVTGASDYWYGNGVLTIDADKILGDIEITVVATDISAPTISELKPTAYNAFEIEATDGVGITHYFIKTNSTKPTATEIGWKTIANINTIDSITVGTYYVWVKDAVDNISNSASISAVAINVVIGEFIDGVKINENGETSIIALERSTITLVANVLRDATTDLEISTFDGWTTSSTRPENSTLYSGLTNATQPLGVDSSGATYYAYATMNTAKYKIEAYKQLTTLTGYETTVAYDLGDFEGIIGESTNVQLSDLVDIEGFDKPKTITQQTIAARDYTTIVKVYYNRKIFDVTLSQGTGTTLTATSTEISGEQKWVYGLEYTLTATLNDGYSNLVVKVNGNQVELTDNKYAFQIGASGARVSSEASYIPIAFNGQTIQTLKYSTFEQTLNFAPATGGSGSFEYTMAANSTFSIADKTKATFTVNAGAVASWYASFTVIARDTETGNSITAAFNIQIQKADLEFSNLTATAITYGQKLSNSTITGKATNTNDSVEVAGSFKFVNGNTYPRVSDSNTTVYEIEFTPEANSSCYNIPTNYTLTLTINKATPTVSVTGTTAYTYGLTWGEIISGLTIKNSLNETGNGIYKYSVDTATTPKASATLYTLIVTYTPTSSYSENYNEGTGRISIRINKACVAFSIPTLTTTYASKTWAELKTEVIEAAHSATNATHGITVDGTITYVVKQGETQLTITDTTVLNAGTYSIAATFTPTDTTNYHTTKTADGEDPITSTFSLVINRAMATLTFGEGGDNNLSIEFNTTINLNSSYEHISLNGAAESEKASLKFTSVSFNENTTGNSATWHNGAGGASNITYVTAIISGGTLTLNCQNCSSASKIYYIEAESTNYTFTGLFTLQTTKAEFIKNVKLTDEEVTFNNDAQIISEEKINTELSYFVKVKDGDTKTVLNKTISIIFEDQYLTLLDSDIIKDEAGKILGVKNVGVYIVTYTYSDGGNNYEDYSVSATLTITQATLSTPIEVTWNKGVVSWDAVTTFNHKVNGNPASLNSFSFTYTVILKKGNAVLVTTTTSGTEINFTENLENNGAGTYTVTVQAMSSNTDNCAHSAITEPKSQYVTLLVGSEDQTGYTLKINGVPVTKNSGVNIISGESLSVGVTILTGYKFNGLKSNNNAVTFTDSTKTSTTLTFTSTTEILEVEISADVVLKTYTVTIVKGAGVTLEYKLNGAESFAPITESSLTLNALSSYVFKYSVSGGYKFVATLFGASYTNASKDNITHYQTDETAKSISITTELITYTINVVVPTTQTTFGTAYINTANNFNSVTTTSVTATGFNTTIAYLKATSANESDYKFAGYSFDNASYITLTDVNSAETTITSLVFGHEDVTLTIKANFTIIGERTLTYQFYVMDTKGDDNLEKTSEAEVLTLDSNITAGMIVAKLNFYNAENNWFVANGIVLNKVNSSLTGDLFTANATTDAYTQLSDYAENYLEKLDNIELSNHLTISFYFKRLEKTVTISYENESEERTTVDHTYLYGASLSLSDFDYISSYTTIGATISFNYNTSYISEDENEPQTQIITHTIENFKLTDNEGALQGVSPNIIVETDFILYATYEVERGLITVTNKSRIGYTFLGWYNNTESKEVVIQNNVSAITPENDTAVTYYAKWELNAPTSVWIEDYNNEIKTEFIQTYNGSEFTFTANFSHLAGDFTNVGERVSYIWQIEETQKSTNNTMSLTNVNESGYYTLTITLTDADGLTTEGSQTVIITINKADLLLNDKIYFDLSGTTEDPNEDIYYLNSYYGTLPTLYASHVIPIIGVNSDGHGEKVSSISWTKFVSKNDGIKVDKTLDGAFTNLFSDYNRYYFIAVSNDNNYADFEYYFEINAEAVKAIGITASYTQGTIYSSDGGINLQNLKHKNTNSTYWLAITLNFNDGSSEVIDVTQSLEREKVTIKVSNSESFDFSALRYTAGTATTLMNIAYQYSEDLIFLRDVEITVTAVTASHLEVLRGTGYKNGFVAFEVLDTNTIIVKLYLNNGASQVLTAVSDYSVIYQTSDATSFRATDDHYTIVYNQNNLITATVSISVDKADLTCLPDGSDSYTLPYGMTLKQIEETVITHGIKFAPSVTKTTVPTVKEEAYRYDVIYNPDNVNYNDFTGEIYLTIQKTDLDISVLGNEAISYDGNSHYATAQVNSYVSSSAPITIYYSQTELNESNYNTLASGVFTADITTNSLQNLWLISVKNTGDRKTVYYYIQNQNYNTKSGSCQLIVTGLIAVDVSFSTNSAELTYNTNLNSTIVAYITESTSLNTVTNYTPTFTYSTSLGGGYVQNSDFVEATISNGTITLIAKKPTTSTIYIKLTLQNDTHAFNTSGYTITVTKINKGERTLSWQETTEEQTYTGSNLTVTKQVNANPQLLTGESIQYLYYLTYFEGSLSNILQSSPINAGTYYVVAVVVGSDYFEDVSTQVLTLTVNKQEVAISAVIHKQYTYNKNNQELLKEYLTVTAESEEVAVEDFTLSEIKDPDGLSASYAVNAGIYKVTVQLTMQNLTGSVTIDWEVKKFTDNKQAKVLFDDEYTAPEKIYNGQEQTFNNLGVYVYTDEFNETIPNNHITLVEYTNNINVSQNAQLTITVNTNNFEFEVSQNFEISPKTIYEKNFYYTYNGERVESGFTVEWAENTNYTIQAAFEDDVIIDGDDVVLTLINNSTQQDGVLQTKVTGLSGNSANNYKLSNSIPVCSITILRYYYVTLNADFNGGTIIGETTPIKAKNKTTITDFTEIKASKADYEFIGWAKETDATEKIDSLYVLDSNVTLYAIYKKDLSLTVVYSNTQSKPVTTRIPATLYNNQASVSVNLNSVWQEAEQNAPTGYKFLKLGESGTYTVSINNSTTIIKAFYTKDVTLTRIIGTYKETETRRSEYMLNEDNILVLNESKKAEFILQEPDNLRANQGKFTGWAFKNADGTYSYLTNQEKFITDEDSVIYAVLEATINYSRYFTGMGIFAIIICVLVILLIFVNSTKNRKKIAVAQIQNIIDEDDILQSNYSGSGRAHERIRDKRLADKDRALLEDEYTPLLNKEKVKGTTFKKPQNSLKVEELSPLQEEKTNINNNVKSESQQLSNNKESINSNKTEPNVEETAKADSNPYLNNMNNSSQSSDIQSILDKYNKNGSN